MGASTECASYSTLVDTAKTIFFTSGILPPNDFAPIFYTQLLAGIQQFMIPQRIIEQVLDEVFTNAGKYNGYIKLNVKLKGSGNTLGLAYFRVSFTDVWDLLR
jgi:hypothetical protein